MFDDSIFLEHKGHWSDMTKSIVCKTLGINVMIEGVVHNAQKLAQENIMTFVSRRPWNASLKNGEYITTVGNNNEDDARQEIKWIYQATH